jgi:hypothetical protein
MDLSNSYLVTYSMCWAGCGYNWVGLDWVGLVWAGLGMVRLGRDTPDWAAWAGLRFGLG